MLPELSIAMRRSTGSLPSFVAQPLPPLPELPPLSELPPLPGLPPSSAPAAPELPAVPVVPPGAPPGPSPAPVPALPPFAPPAPAPAFEFPAASSSLSSPVLESGPHRERASKRVKRSEIQVSRTTLPPKPGRV
jgi:hypothetical protein